MSSRTRQAKDDAEAEARVNYMLRHRASKTFTKYCTDWPYLARGLDCDHPIDKITVTESKGYYDCACQCGMKTLPFGFRC